MACDGYNPLRWDCDKRGCFNKLRRPKIEMFHDCFPGRISFGDVDGIVEVKGKALMLEWKSEMMPLPTGQQIMYSRITKGKKITVICVVGDAETMNVTHYGFYYDGKFSDWRESNLQGVKEKIKEWVEKMSKLP